MSLPFRHKSALHNAKTRRYAFHRSFRIVLLSALLCWPFHAHAGAWPRGEGQLFVSYSYRHSGSEDPFHAVFYDAGVTDDLTFTLDMSSSETVSTMLAMTWSFAPSDAVWQRSAGFGYGILDEEISARVKAHLGRGWQWQDHSGWFTADAMWTGSGESTHADYKLDFTLGLSLNEGRMAFAQLFMSWDERGAANHSGEMHYALPLSDRFTLDLGVSQSFNTNDTSGFGAVMSIWAQF